MDDKDSSSSKKKSLKTSSQSSIGSNKSIGMGPSLRMSSSDIRELTRETENVSTSRLTPEGGLPPGESMYDCMAYLIYCPVHEKIVLSKALWLPFIACPPNKTYHDSATDGLLIILSKDDKELDATLLKPPPLQEMSSISLVRVQLPNQKFIARIIQLVRLGKSNADFKCCQNTKRIRWLPLSDALAANIEGVWGPEVSQFAKLIKQPKPLSFQEHGLEQAFKYVTKDQPNNLEEEMLQTLGVQQKEVEKLYSDFLEHCFPSFYMTIDSFKDYMTKYGYEKNHHRFLLLFNAYNFNNNGYLNFHELLLGLASMEPNSPHGETRVKFVFRYYDIDSDGFLSEPEFKKLVKDIFPNDDQITIQTKVKDAMKAIGVRNGKIAFDDFSKAVGSKTFRGTSSLCRSTKPVFSQINRSMTSRTERRTSAKKSSEFLKANRKNKGICLGCRGKKYDHSLHSIRLDTNGRCVEPRTIFEPDSIDNQMNAQRYSMEYVFNTRSIPHVFLDMIREFSQKKHKEKGFMSEDKDTLVKYLQNLCSVLENLLMSEERVVKINSPAYLIGDILSNLDDLMIMEKLLWQSIPIVSANYVFLGNFVDEGKYGIECALYLFALKLIAPDKFILLRGNHEVREVQKQNKFLKECLDKYGQQSGKNIWDLINSVFDKLPLSVIIDESIFCSHGGIPASTAKVDDINHIVSDLKDPEKESAIAWELLNNQPATQEEFAEASDSSTPTTSGFVLNKKRGTGFLFNEQAANNFLNTNGFSHMIRGNDVSTNGYAFHFGDKCLTVFSSWRFSNDNDSSAVLVDSDKIRCIRLDIPKSEAPTDPPST